MRVVSLQEAYCEYLRTINYISHALLEEAGSQSKIGGVAYMTDNKDPKMHYYNKISMLIIVCLFVMGQLFRNETSCLSFSLSQLNSWSCGQPYRK